MDESREIGPVDKTTEHHLRCDDNGWDHPGPCVVETDFYDDEGNLIGGGS